MKDLLVSDIIKITGGKLIYGNLEEKCESYSKDTRTIKENDVYIGIKGENFDGNDFYIDAFNKGAKIAILDKKMDYKSFDNKTIILVNNSKIALGKIAKYKRDLYDIPVVAVTGSVGKTSTRDIITSVLSTKYKVLSTVGNLNNDIGLPLTILTLKDENAMVLEMGMNNLNEISYLSKIASPTIAVITNVGTAHIGNLGSRENILKAKLEIIDGLKENGLLIINNDNDMIHNNINKISCKYKTIGIDNKSDFMATNIIDNVFSSEFEINNENFNINVGGNAFIYNSLVAYAVGKELNIDVDNIKIGIKNFKLTKNRMEKIINKNGTTIINDTYNASYDSVKNAIDLLNKSDYKRKIFVFGDILELGKYSKEIHEKIANDILNSNINIIITVGKETKYTSKILKDNNFKNVYEFSNEKETYDFLKSLLNKDDIILLKGSNGMKLFNIVDEIK